MIRADLNIVQGNLGRMRFGGSGARHALERALDDGELLPETKSKLLTAKSCIETALGQVSDAQAIVHELKNGQLGGWDERRNQDKTGPLANLG